MTPELSATRTIGKKFQFVSLGDHVRVLSGFAFDSKLFGSVGETPVIRIRDVVRGFTETYYTGSFDSKFLINRGDLLIGMDGDFNRAVWNSDPALLNQRVCKLSALPESLDQRYLYHFLQTALLKVWNATPFATVKHLSVKTIREIRIPLPSLEEQGRIADILDKADALRTKRREAIAHLDTLGQSIFNEMFGDPVLNLSGYEERELVELCLQSDDIKCGPFGTQLSKNEYKTSGIPLWGIRQVNAGFATLPPEFVDEQTAERLSAYSVVPGDIVMTRKGDVGKCAVYPRTRTAGVMHSDVLRVRLGPRVETEFISHQLHHSPAIRRQVDLISQGAIMKGINVTKLKALRVLTPPLEMQQEFTRRVATVEQLKAKHHAQLTELDNLFLSLQDRAFKGEL